MSSRRKPLNLMVIGRLPSRKLFVGIAVALFVVLFLAWGLATRSGAIRRFSCPN